ncbi:MAG: hypothetical protein SPM04_06565 [Lachnospira sp.]|nr:hypothetical protein [Lachnospira sp.]
MLMREKEVRTDSLDLLMFRLVVRDDNDMVMEVKNGKRTDCIRYEDFRKMADEFWKENKAA